MRTSIVLASLVLTLLSLGLPSALAAARPPSVKGSVVQGNMVTAFRAKGTPVRARGDFVQTFATTGETRGGTVDCLALRGRRAVLAGEFAEPVEDARFFAVYAVDKGPGGSLDQFSFRQKNDPFDCVAELDQVPDGASPIADGDIALNRGGRR
jgi:hypothetical protein